MTVLLLFCVALLLLPDLYIAAVPLRGAPLVWTLLCAAPTLVALVLLAAWSAGHAGELSVRIFFFILLCVALPKLCFVALSLAGRAAGLALPRAAAVGDGAGLLVAGILCAAFLYGSAAGWRRLVVRHAEIAFPTLPAAFDGYRIVHLSDLHAGSYGTDSRFIERLVGRVNDLDADIILFTGDAVNTAAGELEPFMEPLARLRARDGVCSVLGNHDYCTYRRYERPDGAARNLEEVKRRERALGWELLLDTHRMIRRGTDSIALAGVENISYSHFPRRGDLARALEGIPEGLFTILMSHDPSHWRREVLPTSSVALTLSGHTHAMQLEVAGCSPSAWVYPEWGGLYEEGGRRLFVSRGVGGTIPFRLGAWPRIDVITLRRGGLDR